MVIIFFMYLFNLMETTPAVVRIGDETRLINTRSETVAQLFEELDIVLRDGDVVSVDMQDKIQENMTITVNRARGVMITVQGVSSVYNTPLTNPADILQETNVVLQPEDQIRLDGTSVQPEEIARWQLPVNHIVIQRALTVTIVDEGTQMTARSAGNTVGDALDDAGVEVYLADKVEPSLSENLHEDMTITIQRAIPATIVADGTTLQTRTHGDTVSELMADAQITLMGLDYTIPAETVAVRPNMTVRVIRVYEEILSETEIIPFGSTEQLDSSLELDQIRLIEPGTNGLRRTSTRVRYENGVPIRRIPEGTAVIREPQDRVVAYGTGIVPRPIDTEQGPRQYWRKLRLYATSYHPAALGGDNVTATGRILTKGIVGIDPDLIPYGTQLYIPGYGIGIAADTGAPRNTTRWIDLGYDDENFEIWARYTDVYILTPVPDDIQYILPD